MLACYHDPVKHDIWKPQKEFSTQYGGSSRTEIVSLHLFLRCRSWDRRMQERPDTIPGLLQPVGLQPPTLTPHALGEKLCDPAARMLSTKLKAFELPDFLSLISASAEIKDASDSPTSSALFPVRGIVPNPNFMTFAPLDLPRFVPCTLSSSTQLSDKKILSDSCVELVGSSWALPGNQVAFAGFALQVGKLSPPFGKLSPQGRNVVTSR